MKQNKGLTAFISVTFLIILNCSCNPLSEKEIEYRQSFESGKAVYEDECQKCHKTNGEGLGTLYPPLANSDYLQSHLDQLPCIIFNGIKGETVVNGKKFNWEMPPHNKMDEIQMSAILTYVRSKWGNNKGIVSYKEARIGIDECRK